MRSQCFTTLGGVLLLLIQSATGQQPAAAPATAEPVITIPNSYAVQAEKNKAEITADVRSSNRAVKIAAVECFLDSTNKVFNGRGVVMRAVDGMFDSTNETAKVTLAIGGKAGQRHEIYVHARGSDMRWSPFVTVVFMPNVDDILNKVRKNYQPLGGQ